jgi:hypothetical protein
MKKVGRFAWALPRIVVDELPRANKYNRGGLSGRAELRPDALRYGKFFYQQGKTNQIIGHESLAQV